jgi:toxin YoeB
MAKRVIWSARAQNDRKAIFSYWNKRNDWKTYSKKLNQPFEEAVRLISHFPKIGKQTDDKNARIKIVRDYLIIYDETDDTIYILAVWDSRQDPSKGEQLTK